MRNNFGKHRGELRQKCASATNEGCFVDALLQQYEYEISFVCGEW